MTVMRAMQEGLYGDCSSCHICLTQVRLVSRGYFVGSSGTALIQLLPGSIGSSYPISASGHG